MPPVVVETKPVSEANGVAPGIVQLQVRFSKAMEDDSWSWSTAGPNPKVIRQPHYTSDHRTCSMTVKLEPGTTYAYWLNSSHFHGFTDVAGRPAVPYLLIFRTRSRQRVTH